MHAKFSPSAMYRWKACPGCIRMSQGIEPTSNVFADDGTRAHDRAANALKKGLEVVPIDEQSDAIFTYLKFVRELIRDYDLFAMNPAQMHVEVWLDLSHVYHDCGGTADVLLYFPDENRIAVIDYKHGAGIPVEIGNGHINYQLRYYGLAATHFIRQSCGVTPETVDLHIVQPRCAHVDGPIRGERLPVRALFDFQAELVEAAKRADDPAAPLIAGDHCRFCPAAGICPELRGEVETLVDRADIGESAVQKYDPLFLAELLEKLPRLESWARSVREFAYNEAIRGRVPPGFKLVAKRPTRKWRADVTPETLMTDLALDTTHVYETVAKSPAQVEKVLHAKAKHLLEKYVTKESSGMTLVPESDARENAAIDPKKYFKPVAEQKLLN